MTTGKTTKLGRPSGLLDDLLDGFDRVSWIAIALLVLALLGAAGLAAYRAAHPPAPLAPIGILYSRPPVILIATAPPAPTQTPWIIQHEVVRYVEVEVPAPVVVEAAAAPIADSAPTYAPPPPPEPTAAPAAPPELPAPGEPGFADSFAAPAPAARCAFVGCLPGRSQ